MAARGRAFVRHRGRQAVRRVILLVGEGQETEPNYFRGLWISEAETRRRFRLVIKRGPGRSPTAVIDFALAEMKRARMRSESFDETICVLDVEHGAKVEEARQARAYAQRHGIQLVLSNPSFEVWFLAHFVRSTRSFLHGNAVLVALDGHWRQFTGKSYSKSQEGTYQTLRGKLDTAVTNAHWVRNQSPEHADKDHICDCNSATEVHSLVKRLLGR